VEIVEARGTGSPEMCDVPDTGLCSLDYRTTGLQSPVSLFTLCGLNWPKTSWGMWASQRANFPRYPRRCTFKRKFLSRFPCARGCACVCRVFEALLIQLQFYPPHSIKSAETYSRRKSAECKINVIFCAQMS